MLNLRIIEKIPEHSVLAMAASPSPPINMPGSSCFTLLVQGRPILCSQRVIASSTLFMDMVELVEDTASPIPIPAFISRQIMLDLVEMVEKGDWECAHLVLVSLSYLLDFLIAVDFLGCDKLKCVIEEKVKDKLNDSNWIDVLNYTKNILGLDTTVKDAIEFLCKRLLEMVGTKDTLNIQADPYQDDYEQFSPDIMKIVMESESLGSCFKFCILRKWAGKNLEKQESTFYMLVKIKFKDLDDVKMGEIESEVKKWDLSDELLEMFLRLLDTAKKERELESLMKEQLDKRKQLQRHEHFLNRMVFGIPGDPEFLLEL